MKAFRKSKKKKHMDPDLKSLYHEKCVDAAIIINRERENFYTKNLSTCQGDARATYKIVNRLLDKECGSRVLPNGENDAETANALGDFFDTKVKNIYAGIESEQKDTDAARSINDSAESNPYKNTSFTDFSPILDDELIDIIFHF